MRKSGLERALDVALQDRDWLALTLTDVREEADELRNVLDRALGAAERNRSALTEIQLCKSRFDTAALTSCNVRVTDTGEAGVFRLIFRRHQAAVPKNSDEQGVRALSRSGSHLFLSIPLNSD